MNSKNIIRALVILLILFVTIGCDQVSKNIVRKKVNEYQTINVIGSRLVIEKVENTGAFLSMGDSASGPIRIIFLNVIPLLLILASLVYILVKVNLNRTTLLAIILMIGGGFGNIYDRIAHGSVTDFIYINLGGIFHTGIFNVADMCITAGISIILLQSWFKKKTEVETPSIES
jgi:signal peptidase II